MNRATITEGEKKEPEWWCLHWKDATWWLITRLEQLLDEKDNEHIEGIIRAALPEYKRSLGMEED